MHGDILIDSLNKHIQIIKENEHILFSKVCYLILVISQTRQSMINKLLFCHNPKS